MAAIPFRGRVTFHYIRGTIANSFVEPLTRSYAGNLPDNLPDKELSTVPRDTLVHGSTAWNTNMDAMVHIMGAADTNAARAYHAIKDLDSGDNLNMFKLENEP
jgi:hypothetical protein